jgi:hypothetical protein
MKVNRTLLRRSATLKMFVMFDSTGERFLAGSGAGRRLAVTRPVHPADGAAG